MRVIARSAVVVAVMVASGATSAHARPAPPRTRILIVYAHAGNAPGVVRYSDQIKRVVREKIPSAEIYEEFLDLDRFPDPARQPQLARGLTEKYRNFAPDAIVVEGAAALRFTTDRLAGLFAGVPVVYGAVFEPIVDFSKLPSNVVGRRQQLPFAATYTLAHALQPDAQDVVVVGGVSDTLISAEARRQITPLLNGARLTIYQNWSYDELLDSLRRLSPGTFVVLSEFTKDRLGRTFIPADLTATLSRAASAPVYGIARNWVGDGIVGGGVMDFSEDGMRVGRIVLRVLARRPNDAMPASEIAAPALVVDWRQLKRWGLSEDLLPPSTEIMFRPASTWERYRTFIVAALALFAVESMLMAFLLLERKRRVDAQRAIEQQIAYERMMRSLADEVVTRAPGDLTRALINGLTRIGQFFGANAVVLVPSSDGPVASAPRLAWIQSDDSVRMVGVDAKLPESVAGGGRRSAIALTVGEATYGQLELYGLTTVSHAAATERLRAACDLIAAAMARSGDARVLEQTRRQVEHLSRVMTVSGLATAVSHQLRQPLAAIRLNAEAGTLLLRRAPPEVEETRLALQDIVHENERAVDVIENFRAHFRKNDAVSTAVNINAVCRQVEKLVESEVSRRQARLILRLSPDVPAVRGDPVQLQQALLNLTLNALDALAESATQREAVISTAWTGDDVEVRVSDTGPGFTSDAHRRLFEPFFSTKVHGVGMGLTIVSSIVERHRGSVRAENRVAGGALFTVTLPAGEANAPS